MIDIEALQHILDLFNINPSVSTLVGLSVREVVSSSRTIVYRFSKRSLKVEARVLQSKLKRSLSTQTLWVFSIMLHGQSVLFLTWVLRRVKTWAVVQTLA